MQTAIHVTHEATQRVGGIGAVLHGLLTSRTYLKAVPRNILVGLYWPGEGQGDLRLGPGAEVLYSSLDALSRSPLAGKFREIEEQFNVRIVYGRRKFSDPDTGVVSMPEVLLIDVSTSDLKRLGEFKYTLWDRFAVDSAKYETTWDYEQWLRLAQPAIAAMHALGAGSELAPAVVLAHEYVGIPTALAAIADYGRSTFRTIFYAHECATMRRLVEQHHGHDTMFYNVTRTAIASGRYVEDVFGDQSSFYKHALVKASRFCDGIFAVGDYTLKEMRFLGPEFAHVDAQLAYNGVPCWRIGVDEKMQSRQKLRRYCDNLLGYEPDYLFTHVTRLGPSKGLWRDIRVLEHVEKQLRSRNETAVLLVLSTDVPRRREDDVLRMEHTYKWPVAHRENHPDLSAGEAAYYLGVQEFNARSRSCKIVFINQFGFSQRLCGRRVPADMELMDLRKGSDAEFGQSIYEPFGIAQVEPISFGGICVLSECCGCAGFVSHVSGGQPTPNVIVADYTELPVRGLPAEQLLAIGQAQRDEIEHRVAEQVAGELMSRLPRTPEEFEQFIDRGHRIAEQMSWDVVARDYVVPGIVRAAKAQRLRQIA